MKTRHILVLAVVAALLAGCGDPEPKTVSDQIGITLGLKETDILGNTPNRTVDGRKNISTETSNPYAEFLRNVTEQFGTAAVDIRLLSVKIQLMEAKEDVSAFEDLFSGKVDVFLAPDDAAAGYTVATLAELTGSGPTEMQDGPDADKLGPFQSTLRAGVFRVGVRGATALAETAKFEAKIAVTIEFGAYEM